MLKQGFHKAKKICNRQKYATHPPLFFVFHFRHDIKLYEYAIALAEKHNATGRARRLWEKLINIFPTVENYLKAAKYFYKLESEDERGQSGQANSLVADVRNYLQLGIRKYGSTLNSVPLWCEWIKLELLVATKLRYRISSLLDNKDDKQGGDSNSTTDKKPLTDQEIIEKGKLHGLQPAELAIINGSAVEIIYESAIKSLKYQNLSQQSIHSLPLFLYKITQILENFPFMEKLTKKSYEILASKKCLKSAYSWHCFALKIYKKSSSLREICNVYNAGIRHLIKMSEKYPEMVEITSQPKILVNFYLELLKEYSESTVVSRNKRQKKSVLKAFLEVYENNVVQHNIFLENFLEDYRQV